MNNISLPTEILEEIVEEFVSECADSSRVRFVPRWYLTPLLRVSKRWNALCTRHLYQSIAIGSAAPFEFPEREGENLYQTRERRQGYAAIHRLRKGHEVAKDLHGTLTTNPRLAVSVERLQLGMEPVRYHQEPEWTQTNIGILQLCPNVQHVEIRGYEDSELDDLVDALKDKLLISFYISPRRLLDIYQRTGGSFSQILEMMQSWPKLRSIRAEHFLDDVAEDDTIPLDTSQASRCCPDLTEIIITGATLHPSELRLIRAMCSRDVAKLSLSLYRNRIGGNGDAAVAALCECLRAWSPTLQYFKISIRDSQGSYRPLSEAIAGLYELRELQFFGMMLDFGFISNLPRLERFACRLLYKAQEVQNLSQHLNNPEMFPSLRHIVLFLGRRMEPANELQSACRRRNVQLHKCWPGSEMTTVMYFQVL